MTALTTLYEQFGAYFEEADPGDGGSFRIEKQDAVFPLTIAESASETGTLPEPSRAGLRMLIFAQSVGAGGTRTLTSTTPLDKAGNASIVFSAVDDLALLRSVPVGDGAFEWRCDKIEGATGLQQTGDFVADTLKIGGVISSPYKVVTLNMPLNGNCVDQCFFVADRAYQLVGVDYVHATAGSDGGSVNVQVTKDTGTNAPGAGTDLLTNNTNAGFNCKGTANTVQAGTLTGTTASLQLAAGDRLSVDFAGTVTALAGVHITAKLKPI